VTIKKVAGSSNCLWNHLLYGSLLSSCVRNNVIFCQRHDRYTFEVKNMISTQSAKQDKQKYFENLSFFLLGNNYLN